MRQRLPEDNSLIVTVRSSEHKIFSDEESSTEMIISVALQRDHIRHRVLRDFYPIYDFSSKGCKDKLNPKWGKCLIKWNQSKYSVSLPFRPRHVRTWRSRSLSRACIMAASQPAGPLGVQRRPFYTEFCFACICDYHLFYSDFKPHPVFGGKCEGLLSLHLHLVYWLSHTRYAISKW